MEFGDESLIDEVMDYDNLLIVKTVSKAFSLAGIRMGYIVANEDIITSIEKLELLTI
ncbi:MAG: aminotransferase class I/II-fold pyridoxal phosphate-dependent enzyme [Intestinibacter sp.]